MADLNEYFQIASESNFIKYITNLETELGPTDWLLVDEADQLIFSDPLKFKNFVGKRRAIALSSTTPDKEETSDPFTRCVNKL